MRRPYLLSKIGKEERKSGSFRLCGTIDGRMHAVLPRAACEVLDASPSDSWRQRTSPTSDETLRAPGIELEAARWNSSYSGILSEKWPRIKKLPQVGQEPVEAVESRRSSPDAPIIMGRREKSKEILGKIRQYSSQVRLDETPILRPSGRSPVGSFGELQVP
jgi:hypothetical protein